MIIDRFDHLVLTTANLKNCLYFYGTVLGLNCECKNDRYAIYFGQSKINIHTRPAEFLPAAAQPLAGSLDFCLIATGDIEKIRQEIIAKGYPIEIGPVLRHGALGEMDSLYLRDPDGNLVEIAVYRNK